LRDAAESIEQSLDSVLDRHGRMAVAASQFQAGDAFDLELK
jgi:hypothetical protein